MALGRSPPQAGAAGEGSLSRPVGSGDAGGALVGQPRPLLPKLGGSSPWVRWDIAVCPPNHKHSGVALSPTSFPPELSGSHGGTRLPMPACQAQLRARHEIPGVDEPATSWSPVCARRPAGRARILSLNTHSLRKCADFCPFAKWGNQGTEGGRSAFPRRPDRKRWSEVSHPGPAD